MGLPILAAALAGALVIAFIIGGTFITAYWRDVVTKEYESEIAVSKDETVEQIINDDSIPDDQKLLLLIKYLDTIAPTAPTAPGDFGELAKYIPIVIGGYVAAAILGGRR